MPQFDVFYTNQSYFRDGVMGYDYLARRGKLPRIGALVETHDYAGMFEADDLEDLFGKMQDRALEKPNLSHTSMSVGDVVVEASGKVWLVDGVGFRELKAEPTPGGIRRC